jgi:hypothetical protein
VSDSLPTTELCLIWPVREFEKTERPDGRERTSLVLIIGGALWSAGAIWLSSALWSKASEKKAK